MDLELIRKLNNFNIYANLGFQFDGIDRFEKYTIAYHNKIKDFSEKLTQEIGEDYSVPNLKLMKKFYLTYKSSYTLCNQIS